MRWGRKNKILPFDPLPPLREVDELDLDNDVEIPEINEEGEALLDAVLQNVPTRIQDLIDRGVHPDYRNANGENAVHLAATYADANMVHFLIERGCSPALADEWGRRPIHAALERQEQVTALEITMLLAEFGVNFADQHLVTPLHIAATMGHREATMLLLQKRADVTAQDDDGNTPLHWAVFRDNNGDIISLLMQHNALPKLPNRNNVSPLRIVKADKRSQNFQVLVRAMKARLRAPPGTQSVTF